jgi:N-6 DNA Methylase
MQLAEVLDVLDYSQSPYYLKTGHKQEPEVASLFRAAYNAGIDGIYVFQSSTEKNTTFSVQPAVYIAEAQTPEDARVIHRSLWNLGQAPFLIVVLPDHIRVYTGFDYSQEDDRVGIIEPPIGIDRNSILEQLTDFCAEAINNGQLWRNRSKHLKPDRRVDKRLLKNLSKLGQFLREKMELPPKVAHALIGKYVYIRYLRDRNILSDQWFQRHDIDIETVLGRNATVNGLHHLCTVLDNRFNGSIFPLNFDSDALLKNEHVEQVASVFKGDELLPGGIRQRSLENFQVYDFAYIPIELLSSIYEQFLHIEGKGKKVGAYYTPEYLADYLISEMSSIKPFREGMKVLDPACGSGVFLVLIYAQLVETRLAQSETNTLPLPELLELLKHIYGIEREPDACYVTEFSLILMLLHYVDVSEFLHESHFKLPSLHNTHIFQCDFFDDSSSVWIKNMRFDWIIGNPPWIAAKEAEELLVATWISTHDKQHPVDNNSVAEAFSWRVLDLLAPTGYAGLILPAALLYNLEARKYRRFFFEQCEVQRMTNFSNLRAELFEGKATEPTVTVIYHQALAEQEKPLIDHYGPFAINQITKSHGKIWTITINEHEYQTVSPYEAALGDITTWKFALWGTHRDKRAIARLQKLFPLTLGQLCKSKPENTWHLHEGSQLRSNSTIEHNEDLEYRPELVGKQRLDTIKLNASEYLFSIPDYTLENIPQEECYIRKQGGSKGLLVSKPPHIIMNAGWKYSIYSDTYFVIKPRQIGLSVPPVDADHLRALSVILSSSIIEYYLFFQVPQWGIERDVITLNAVKSIPIPALTLEQIEQLAALQQKLVIMEHEQDSKHAQTYLDEQITRILRVPESITTLVTEFLQLRSMLVGGGTKEAIQWVQQRPNQEALQAYAQQLTNDLDGFLDSGKTRHRVTVEQSSDLICCTVEFVRSDIALSPIIREASSQNRSIFTRLQQTLKDEFSQWVYVQKGLKIFGSTSVSLYKVPQLINWTRTQAMNDADDIIAEILSTARQPA